MGDKLHKEIMNILHGYEVQEVDYNDLLDSHASEIEKVISREVAKARDGALEEAARRVDWEILSECGCSNCKSLTALMSSIRALKGKTNE
jgi:hypothetical protein